MKPFLLGVLLALMAASQTAMAIEEPKYTVLEQNEAWELRLYDAYIVAETWVDGDLRQSGNRAFRILAGYIFGDNQSEQKMAMTAPVVSGNAGAGDGRTWYHFVMEREYDLDTLPVPNDQRVTLRTLPQRLVAAHRFSGTWNEDRIDGLTKELLAQLDKAGFEAAAPPMLARYDGPMTPWFLRRNEILIEVQPRD